MSGARDDPTDHAPAILGLAVASGLFPPEATDEVAQVLAGVLKGELGPDHVWLTDDDGGPVGVAYYAPEGLTEGTWNLYILAIDPDRQRQGRGAALVRHVEGALAARRARLLLIETSGLGSFERTRAFYRALGYEEEARIREFYKAGDDKVVFRKALGRSNSPMNALIGQENRTFDGKRRWELLFEDMYLVILETGVTRGRDMNLVGVSANDLRVKWVVGGEIDSPHQFDGIVHVWVRGGEVWASRWSCFNYQLNCRTGEILHREFTK